MRPSDPPGGASPRIEGRAGGVPAPRAGARVVCRPRPAAAVARPSVHPLGRARVRGDGAADPGRPGRTGVGGVDATLADPVGARRGVAGGGGAVLGPARLPASGAAPARGRGGDQGPTRRRGARRRGGAPGTARIGGYTAAAVTAFAFGRRTTVVDTNVRRVLVRAVEGREHAAPALTSAESALAAALVPGRGGAVGHLERRGHGARRCRLHGTSAALRRVPGAATSARGSASGRPEHDGPPRRAQAWHGTDRQVRGAVVQALRDASGPVARGALGDGGRTLPRSTVASPPWSRTACSSPPGTARSAFRPDHRGVPRSGQTLQA